MVHRRRICILAAVATILAALATGQGASAGKRKSLTAAEAISADAVRRHAVVLGSDALEGRAPGTAGGSRAASYIAAELERMGVRPLGDDGSYFQQVPLHGNTPLDDSRLFLSIFGEPRGLALGADYLLYSTGSQTWIPRPAPMVFVGYGIVAPEFDHNDYADVDVRGKVVVYLAGEPQLPVRTISPDPNRPPIHLRRRSRGSPYPAVRWAV